MKTYSRSHLRWGECKRNRQRLLQSLMVVMKCRMEMVMEFDNILKKYMYGKISTELLYNQMRHLFNELLSKHEFCKLEYLKIYPFISELQDEDLYKNHILREKINTILAILEGQHSFSYDLWMNLKKGELSYINDIWELYKTNGSISFEKSEMMRKKLKNINVNTIEDICLDKLLTLLAGLPTTGDDFDMYNSLYVRSIDKNAVHEDIEKMMSILSGQRPIHILLKYVSEDCIYIIV